MPADEVIVIGAGAAGLAAAAQLARVGRRVLILDARDRVGGRIWTRHEPGLTAPVELGAEFIHGSAPENVAWVKRAGKSPIEITESHWNLSAGALRPPDASFDAIRAQLKANQTLATHERSLDDFLRIDLQGILSPQAGDSVRLMAEGFDAADPARASARAIIEEWTDAELSDGPQSRPDGGYTVLLSALSAALPAALVRVRLQSTVREIEWKPGSVTVSGQGIDGAFSFEAARAVITLPLGILQLPAGAPHAVKFAPPLDAKRNALRGLSSGAVIKLNLRFRSAFWESVDSGRYRDASFFHAPHASIPTFWTSLPLRSPLLVAWAGGPRAARLAESDDMNAVVEAALASLETLFRSARPIGPQLDAAYLHDWQHDPFAHGAYSYVAVGGATARAQLAQALEHTLYFAGEATDPSGEAATVTGALRSGERAAREIIDAVSRGRIPESQHR
jgi:monoamine oxidase